MEEINLYKLLRFYVQNWLLILSLTLIGLAAGLAYNEFIQVPMYKSSATLLFVNPSGVSSTQDSTRLNNYVQLFQSRRVIEPVMEQQGIDKPFEQFISGVSATNDKGTEVIHLSVSTADPVVSHNFLTAAVKSFKAEAKEIYGADSLKVVDNAGDAEPPYNVRKPLQLAIASGAGFVLSLIVLFFVYDASGGKAGKLRLKKNEPKQIQLPLAAVAVNKQAPKLQTPKPQLAELQSSSEAQLVEEDVSAKDKTKVSAAASAAVSAAARVKASDLDLANSSADHPSADQPSVSQSKFKAFFVQLGKDFRQGLWLDQPQESAEVQQPDSIPGQKTSATSQIKKSSLPNKPSQPNKSSRSNKTKKQPKTTKHNN